MKIFRRDARSGIRLLTILAGLTISLSLASSAQAQTYEWIEPSLRSAPPAREDSSMTFDGATNSMVLFGGTIEPGYQYLGDTWIFTPTAGWLQLFPATSPSPRGGAAFVYDPVLKMALLFGGGTAQGNGLLGDTWTWDGTTWTQQFPPVSPPPHAFNTEQMAFDASTGTVLLFGGFGPNGTYFGDTWIWNGITWSERLPATSPSPRNTTLTYDAATKQVILFGGASSEGLLDDTWTWNGVTWTQHFPPSSPSPRVNIGLAYDPKIGKVVLFGGINSDSQSLGDTWTWDGTTWTQIQSIGTSPSPRWSPSFAYDPQFEGALLFGGGYGPVNQTWLFR